MPNYKPLLILLASWCGLANSAVPREYAGIPLIFRAEAEDVVSTACLEIPRVGDSPSELIKSTEPKKKLELVFSALSEGNLQRLEMLSDLGQTASERSNASMQLRLFLEQFRKLKVISSEEQYIFGRYFVFFVRLQTTAGGATFESPFVFVRDSAKDYKLLPDRTRALPYVILRRWKGSSLSKQTSGPEYCDISRVASPRYRMPFVLDGVDSGAALYFRGLGNPSIGDPSTRSPVVSAFRNLTDAASKGSVTALLPFLSDASGRWLSGVPEAAMRAQFLSDLAALRLAFVIDMGNVAAIYATLPSGRVGHYYFRREQSAWKMINLGVLNFSTEVFGSQDFLAETALDRPFGRFLRD